MPLWGATANSETFPQFLTTAQKSNTYATEGGWVYKDPKNGDKEEVIVAVRSFATRLGNPNIMRAEVLTRSANTAGIVAVVSYNEKVTVTGVPFLQLSGTYTAAGGSNGAAVYIGGTGTNRLTFKYDQTGADNSNSVTLPTSINVDQNRKILDTVDGTANATSNLISAGLDGSTDVRVWTTYDGIWQ